MTFFLTLIMLALCIWCYKTDVKFGALIFLFLTMGGVVTLFIEKLPKSWTETTPTSILISLVFLVAVPLVLLIFQKSKKTTPNNIEEQSKIKNEVISETDNFIDEEMNSDQRTLPWQLLGKTYQGWWRNQWQIWQRGDMRKMVCLLTQGRVEESASITLAASHRFLAWLRQQTEFEQSTRYSAHSVFQAIRSLADKYNALIEGDVYTCYPATKTTAVAPNG